ncbi:hypothetical protein PHMEG_00012862 [Phytophthora megakarya]|uniref:Uncharacterized protein n=1 Tax=Phytophthora megakarya TaxID=4795 RepID=A0A225W975_9STRA|nr:hypothetical protein PHMEG_00012862 [Phytophthora megakarya]
MAGDEASVFRNISIHSNSVFLFTGRVGEGNVIVIERSAPLGWTGSPGFYEIVGGAVSHVHDSQHNAVNPVGRFNYHWVDDHINVSANIGISLECMNRSFRFAMAAILGAEAINDEKITPWKITGPVWGAYDLHSCCSAILQRLRERESNLHRFRIIPATEDMKQDGVSLEYFNTLPLPNVVVEVDDYVFGLCALDVSERFALTYQFPPAETALLSDFKSGSANGIDINFCELLSCAFAVNE